MVHTSRRLGAMAACGALLLLPLGCATSWEPTSTYERSHETLLKVSSEPPADLYIDGEPMGSVPVSLPVRYREEVAIEERRVSYFRSDPVLATFVAILSLGITVPFNLIPTDLDSRDRPLGSFHENRLELELRKVGFEPWKSQVVLSGEPEVTVGARLIPAGTTSPGTKGEVK